MPGDSTTALEPPPVGAPERGRDSKAAQETAGQASFLIGSRMTTHSTWWVIGSRSKASPTGNLQARGGFTS
jgi:hypothetical protein